MVGIGRGWTCTAVGICERWGTGTGIEVVGIKVVGTEVIA